MGSVSFLYRRRSYAIVGNLVTILKKAKKDKKKASFNVEKLIIENAVYRGPETKTFRFMVQLWKAATPEIVIYCLCRTF